MIYIISKYRNICLNNRTKTPQCKTLTNEAPYTYCMHNFGNLCFVFNQNTNKLDYRAQKGFFVGCDKKVYHFESFSFNEIMLSSREM